MAHDADSFNAGYLIAVANIMHLHGEDTIAGDVLEQLGVSRAKMSSLIDSDYDRAPLLQLYRKIGSPKDPADV